MPYLTDSSVSSKHMLHSVFYYLQKFRKTKDSNTQFLQEYPTKIIINLKGKVKEMDSRLTSKSSPQILRHISPLEAWVPKNSLNESS